MGFAYNIVGEGLSRVDIRDRAEMLLAKNENAIPDRVVQALDFLDQHNIWYVVSRNSPATSCRDAASRRNRLGAVGIPLHDELKSHCTVFYNGSGERRYVILHCRGDRHFDLNEAAGLLKASRPLARMAPDELDSIFGSEYGTVTPFVDMDNVAYQVFDKGVFASGFPPHTMMTNAGDHTWAVEFRSKNLVESLASAYPDKILTLDITEQDDPDSKLQHPVSFGIITGNGPESGMALWRHLNRMISEEMKDGFKGDLSFPHVMVHSIPEMGLSMELEPRQQEVWRHLSKGVRQLCRAGATHIALACHTTHFFTDKIREICGSQGVQFVSMAETAMRHMADSGVKDLTIIGIPYVADLGDWSAYKDLTDIEVFPVQEGARKPLLELGYWVKQTGSNTQGLNKLNHILKVGVKTNSVLIALTEISVLLEGFPKKADKIGGWNIIDPLKIYASELADIYLSNMGE